MMSDTQGMYVYIPINEVTARYNIRAVVNTCSNESPPNNGNGPVITVLKKNKIAFIIGTFAKIINTNLYNSINIKYAIDKKIDCII